MDTKKEVRKEILEKLNNQAREEALRKSEIIKKKLFSLPEFKKAKIVMLYASREDEVETHRMIEEAVEAGKIVALPRCASAKGILPKEIKNANTDLEKGTYGIYEPRETQKDIRSEEIDLIVVPGVAFDRKNRRLGRGKGYYDRFLAQLPRDKVTVGLAFDIQIVENLPHDSDDRPVSKIITN